MSILPDFIIRGLAKTKNMIEGFQEPSTDKTKISYGLSSYGYDARLDLNFIVEDEHFFDLNDYKYHRDTLFSQDPKKFDEHRYKVIKRNPGEIFVLPGKSFCLANTIETFNIPKDILVICVGKSTYARCGIIINVTPLEPGFEGQVTLEISNTSNFPVKLYPEEGICQFLFLKGQFPCERSYSDKKGKYQNQKGITFPKMPK